MSQIILLLQFHFEALISPAAATIARTAFHEKQRTSEFVSRVFVLRHRLVQGGGMEPDLDAARRRLDEKRRDLERMSAMSEVARAPVTLDQQSVGRLSRMDAMQQQAMAEAQERARKRDLVRIEMAERRLAEGDYGWCIDCGEAIPDKRLEIDPMAEKCVRCASG
jgi:DnaK suppressor protein